MCSIVFSRLAMLEILLSQKGYILSLLLLMIGHLPDSADVRSFLQSFLQIGSSGVVVVRLYS